ncbi:hypothetical protein PVAND_001075 [Polypedilum vanderplanki]|uniref:Uncharacterized protein n=1 Tax=Polypedilum vanderplanki TaxID=319348 RepID=A0A9J6BLU3_POLVA|nr:hypothetical protein PVAND_001075 [Polypedilum vanderplanki]
MKFILIFILVLTKTLAQHQFLSPNVVKKLIQVLDNGTHVTAEYDLIPYNNSTKFPFNLNKKIHLRTFEIKNKSKRLRNFYLDIRSAEKRWIIQRYRYQMNLTEKKEKIFFKIIYISECGEFLKEIFNCWTDMNEYILTTFTFKSRNLSTTTFQTEPDKLLAFLKLENIYLLISKNNFESFENEENFEEFMKECKTIPLNYLILMFIFASALFAFFAIYIYEFVKFIIRKIKDELNKDEVTEISFNRKY